MPEWHQFFEENAAEYDQLVACEDYQRNIPRALEQIRPLDGLDVVEFGAGTGRFTCMLAPRARTIRAFDASHHMLETARVKLEATGLHNWLLGVADSRHLPVRDRVADVALAGWTFAYFIWHGETWCVEMDKAVTEMKRVLRPGGTAIILETLGTGRKTPHPPHETLAVYLAWLGEEHSFSSTWIRTDYRFESVAEAKVLIGAFFGDAMAKEVVGESSIVPECTGIWWLEV